MNGSDPEPLGATFFLIVLIAFTTFGVAFLLVQYFFNEPFLRWYGRVRRSYPMWMDRPEDVEMIYSRAVAEFQETGRVEINSLRHQYYLPEYSTFIRRMHFFAGCIFALFGPLFIAIGILN